MPGCRRSKTALSLISGICDGHVVADQGDDNVEMAGILFAVMVRTDPEEGVDMLTNILLKGQFAPKSK